MRRSLVGGALRRVPFASTRRQRVRVAQRHPAPNYAQRSFEIRDIEVIGNYALQPNWLDGHNSGMWTYDRLRAACPCEECRPA